MDKQPTAIVLGRRRTAPWLLGSTYGPWVIVFFGGRLYGADGRLIASEAEVISCIKIRRLARLKEMVHRVNEAWLASIMTATQTVP